MHKFFAIFLAVLVVILARIVEVRFLGGHPIPAWGMVLAFVAVISISAGIRSLVMMRTPPDDQAK